jgi:Adenylate and Guanylate cyclase catalytic domain
MYTRNRDVVRRCTGARRDLVNVPARGQAEQSRPAGILGAMTLRTSIQVTESSYRLLCDDYEFEDRGEIEVKGKGRRRAYLLVGRRAADTSG